jgi:carbonic anhydrase/acetyltransferase-like protein (isoleucine patch superfamily)
MMRGVDIISFRGNTPRIDPTAWIAPGCRIIGDVEIGPDTSIWYNSVLRGDVNAIRVGARTNIQDGSIIHCDSGGADGAGYPTIIGEDVLIGHMAVVHGTTLMAGSFVGIGAITMDGTVIESGGMLAAGAILTPRKRISENELWGGRPAKLMRALIEDEQARNRFAVEHYQELAREHHAAVG